MEWSKKTNEEQTKLLNDLSNLIGGINTGSLLLSQTVVEKAVELIPEKTVDLDDKQNDDFEEHQDAFTKNIRNWVAPILSNYERIQQRLAGPKLEYDEKKHDVLQEHQDAFTKNIRDWMKKILSNYYQIQRLTKPNSAKVAEVADLFKSSNIKEETSAIGEGKIDENTTLATFVRILQNKTMKLVDILEELEEQKKNHAKWNDKTKPNSEIPKFSREEKQQLLYGNFDSLLKSMDGVKMEDKTRLPCDKLESYDGELKALLSLLCAYQEILDFLGSIDKQAKRFFRELDKGFQAHLKTVDDYIV
jgi:hypothetical protein